MKENAKTPNDKNKTFYKIDCSHWIKDLDISSILYIEEDYVISNYLTNEKLDMKNHADILEFCKFLIAHNNLSAHDTIDFYDKWNEQGQDYLSFIRNIEQTFQNLEKIINHNIPIYNTFKEKFKTINNQTSN